MRYFWHPVVPAVQLKDEPKRVRVLGENLVLFRINVAHWRLILNQSCALGLAKSFFDSIDPERKSGWLVNARLVVKFTDTP
jgi:hypothetical protein